MAGFLVPCGDTGVVGFPGFGVLVAPGTLSGNHDKEIIRELQLGDFSVMGVGKSGDIARDVVLFQSGRNVDDKIPDQIGTLKFFAVGAEAVSEMVFGHDVEKAFAGDAVIPAGKSPAFCRFSGEPCFGVFVEFVSEIGIGEAEVAADGRAGIEVAFPCGAQSEKVGAFFGETLKVLQSFKAVADGDVEALIAHTAVLAPHIILLRDFREPFGFGTGIDVAAGGIRTVENVDLREFQVRVFRNDGTDLPGEIEADTQELFQKSVDSHEGAPVAVAPALSEMPGIILTGDEDIVALRADDVALAPDLFRIHPQFPQLGGVPQKDLAERLAGLSDHRDLSPKRG